MVQDHGFARVGTHAGTGDYAPFDTVPLPDWTSIVMVVHGWWFPHAGLVTAIRLKPLKGHANP